MRVSLVISIGLFLFFNYPVESEANGASRKNKATITELSDVKDWKKLIKTKTNVLIYFGSGKSSAQSKEVLSLLPEAAELVKGIGTFAVVDCAGEGKKLCKKAKASPAAGQHVLKHYHNGEFNKDYDRAADKLSSIVNFMKDPTGDLPWEEDSMAQDVLHLPDLPSLLKTVKKESGKGGRGMLVMFYAPWCGYCKRMKPDYATAATELKDEAIVAAIDVNKPENGAARTKYNITGFPTLLYFRNGQMKQQYEGENNKEAIVAFLRNPDAPPVEKPKEAQWSDEPSEVVHLTTDTFDSFLQENPSVLVMFYAPWCGHCKKLKPEWVKAAQKAKELNIPGVLAAVDATQEVEIGKRFEVKGYPTLKYFKDGSFAFEADTRDEEAIIKFLKDPKEPPPPPPPEKPWSEEESAVVHLNEENFKTILRKKKQALVMFYAPWCGHCKRTKPEFQGAAQELSDDPKVLFGAVDCTEQQSLCKYYEVQGYPTIKKFHYLNKEPVQSYDGGRTKDDFVEEMRPGTKPIPAKVDDWQNVPGQEYVHKLTESNYTTFLKSHESALVMFYTTWCGHCKALKPEYGAAASSLAKKHQTSGVLAACDCESNPKMVERYKISGYPTLVYFRHGQQVSEYNLGRKAQDLINFMLRPPKSKDEL